MGAPCRVRYVLRHNRACRIETAIIAALAKTLQTTSVDLMDRRPMWTERLLRLVRALYRLRLRGLVVALPSDIMGEILAASEKMTGPVRGFTNN